ncbi:hypothetical protein VP01_1901g2 [Puccinia sorghi]|uniref:Uncharacterized protein n=1 Tax=Puccinia sorghi TaxID=27349 RepID=A0A0L6VCY5_9BASI|nr:hypothetical protein VP01_1901g2 [Puccinia sorghi]
MAESQIKVYFKSLGTQSLIFLQLHVVIEPCLSITKIMFTSLTELSLPFLSLFYSTLSIDTSNLTIVSSHSFSMPPPEIHLVRLLPAHSLSSIRNDSIPSCISKNTCQKGFCFQSRVAARSLGTFWSPSGGVRWLGWSFLHFIKVLVVVKDVILGYIQYTCQISMAISNAVTPRMTLTPHPKARVAVGFCDRIICVLVCLKKLPYLEIAYTHTSPASFHGNSQQCNTKGYEACSNQQVCQVSQNEIDPMSEGERTIEPPCSHKVKWNKRKSNNMCMTSYYYVIKVVIKYGSGMKVSICIVLCNESCSLLQKCHHVKCGGACTETSPAETTERINRYKSFETIYWRISFDLGGASHDNLIEMSKVPNLQVEVHPC